MELTGTIKTADSGIFQMMWSKDLVEAATCPSLVRFLDAVADGKMRMNPVLMPEYRELVKRELLAGQLNWSGNCWRDPMKAAKLPPSSGMTLYCTVS